MSYEPLDSVWEGSDAELLEKMLDFYPRREPEAILDATVNAGRFWRGSDRPVVGMDIDSAFEPTIVADNRDMPCADASFDVVVYDPPHIGNQGRDKSCKDFESRFGATVPFLKAENYSPGVLYPAFCREAHRVLVPEGVLFAKITDIVNNHRYQWCHLLMIGAAVAAGFTACDMIVKVRKGPMRSTKWKVAHHARKRHTFWLVFRKSEKCE